MDPQAFVQGLVNRGWSVPEASAAAGNAHVESGFRPGIVAPNGDTGLLQWNGARLAGMQRYAAATGRDWRDPEAQLDWIALERSGGSRQFGVDERGGYHKAFAGGGTPADMAATFGHYVERPADLSATVGQRSAMATAYGGGAPRAVGIPAMPAAAPAVAPPGMFARIFAPASAEAAEMPGWGPPPTTAEVAPPPDTATPQFVPPPPPPPPTPPSPPPGVTRPGAAVAPGTPPGTAPLGLSRRSYTSASGQTDVYELGEPSEIAADAAQAGITDFRYASPQQIDYFNNLRDARQRRERASAADVVRDTRPLTESEAKATDYLSAKRDALNQFYKDFPTPADRAKYIGWPYRNVLDYAKYLHKNPEFQRFVDDLAPFQDLEKHSNMLQDGGVNLEPGKVPTGYEPDAESFENRLDDFNFDLNKQLYRQIALRQMSVGDLSRGGLTVMQSYFDRLQDERVAARRAAAARSAGVPADTGPTITVAPPTTTTQPPPQGPGGFAVLGDRPAQ